MEYDYYILFLCDEYCYGENIKCYSLDEIEFILNKADMYDMYVVFGVNESLYRHDVVARGEITLNRTRIKGR